MKTKLLIVLSAFAALVLVMYGINYLLSLHKVSFTIDEEVSSITVYNASEKEAGHLSASGNLKMQNGEYYIIPKGDNLVDDKINFTVKNEDISVEINPSYSEEHLQALLNQEDIAVQAAITAKYPSIIDGYIVSQGKLYKRGKWFGGLLKPKVTDARDQRAPYRIILYKQDGAWVVIRRPEYILTSSRYKDVPIDILRDVNAIAGERGN